MSKTKIAIDPSLEHLSVSAWDFKTDELLGAMLVYPATEDYGPTTRLNRVVDGLCEAEMEDGSMFYSLIDQAKVVRVEMPMVYPKTSQWKGDPNDIVALGRLVGLLERRFHHRDFDVYLPRAWKGTMPKGRAFEKRVRSRLSKKELRRIELPSAESLDHNVWDAVGIGLHMVGRWERRRVIRKR